MKTVVGIVVLLALGSAGCTCSYNDPDSYRPVAVKRRAEGVYSFAPAKNPPASRTGLAAGVVWQEFARWSEEHKEKYRVLSVCPAYGSCLVVTVEDIGPPAIPPELSTNKKK